jgi:hypothetical protein
MGRSIECINFSLTFIDGISSSWDWMSFVNHKCAYVDNSFFFFSGWFFFNQLPAMPSMLPWSCSTLCSKALMGAIFEWFFDFKTYQFTQTQQVKFILLAPNVFVNNLRPNKKKIVVLVTLHSLIFTPDPKLFCPIFKSQLLVPTLFCLVWNCLKGYFRNSEY